MNKITKQSKFKIRRLNTQFLILIFLGLFLPVFNGLAQTTINTNLAGTTQTGSAGNGITFGIENTNAGAQLLTDVAYYVQTVHSNTVFELWMSNTSLSGPQPTAYPAAGWTLIATTTMGTITGTGSIQPVFTGLTHIIPGNTTQRFSLVNTNTAPRYAGAGTPNVFSAGGVNLLLGNHQIAGQDVGYAATITNRRWAGSITFMPADPCTGQVSAGAAVASVTDACAAVPFNLSLNGSTLATGITYQWQSSPAGTNAWTDITGATGMTYIVANQTAATDYRCVVTCTNSNTTATSTVVSVGQNPWYECFCTPVYSTGCATYNLNSFVITGENGTDINDLNTGCSSNTTDKGYDDRRSLFTPVDLIQEGTYPVQLNSTSTSTLQRVSIWIDFNDNGAFEPSEQVLTDFTIVASPAFATASIDIPASADPGIHRMRVRMVYNTTGIDPCTSYASGETHDYDVNILATNCYKPLDIQESDVTKNSVTVTVDPSTNNSGTVSYEYEVRESGAPGSGTTGLGVTGIATTNPFTITGLQPLTKYTIYVRTVCSPTDKSSWAWGPDITTLCDYPELLAAPGKTVCGPQEVDLTAIYDAGTVFW